MSRFYQSAFKGYKALFEIPLDSLDSERSKALFERAERLFDWSIKRWGLRFEDDISQSLKDDFIQRIKEET